VTASTSTTNRLRVIEAARLAEDCRRVERGDRPVGPEGNTGEPSSEVSRG
jgi:hypothetical protein